MEAREALSSFWRARGRAFPATSARFLYLHSAPAAAAAKLRDQGGFCGGATAKKRRARQRRRASVFLFALFLLHGTLCTAAQGCSSSAKRSDLCNCPLSMEFCDALPAVCLCFLVQSLRASDISHTDFPSIPRTPSGSASTSMKHRTILLPAI